MKEETKVQLQVEVNQLTDKIIKHDRAYKFYKEQTERELREVRVLKKRRDKILDIYPNLFN
ncbi:hypothetical protein COE01_17915 [Bacillus thuringiensis]|uniref:hypothetical protein n=1 Tax=Bacillus thuringiensis TaxID=1428 RepID=UPI000BF9A463|nr:hypothetical protein [Bacillus thuringiensis]PEW43436.1 hypothetical protein CN444_22340 [Bacillus thuringiensis]PEY62575.1 hypothetical protein CN352_17235 [Bacillus thuringiensis]PFA11157.1 hypothetical protein CN379_02500 [Bacillus thuringiensis]PFK10739.1 hypothetical protein COJ17_16025 [Bacillus thuringiensis]PFM21000.1 hypothetical protein COJ41_18450 [Bacillus thuringiensis]